MYVLCVHWFICLRQHCIKNKSDSDLDISGWDQEHFHKSFIVYEHSAPCHLQVLVKDENNIQKH